MHTSTADHDTLVMILLLLFLANLAWLICMFINHDQAWANYTKDKIG